MGGRSFRSCRRRPTRVCCRTAPASPSARAGHQDDGSALPAATCAALRRASWLITDEFTPGLGGNRHIDAYIGPETGPGFTDSDWYVTLQGARLTID